ncbi:glycine zipper domain-containing protein [Xanthobacter oligotrophicus]|uniref:Glycine zipper domain-containing protein n=1 Tax=Xanthobacter oligotrophicus TaxID=2607286 RepID=A0ABW6ZZ56_9HYPH|nr:glycine zipper domain-containing protein [Xanthobacter oligotrophicus]MCG5234423.1 glycine zipper domain-containing protein [Xanthobacter oligotrophicus]
MTIRSGLALALAVATFAGTVAPAAAQNSTVGGALIGGTAGALIGGAATGSAGGVAAGAIIGGTTGAIIGNQQDRNRNRAYYFWGNDGRCYLRQSNGAVVRVSRGNC